LEGGRPREQRKEKIVAPRRTVVVPEKGEVMRTRRRSSYHQGAVNNEEGGPLKRKAKTVSQRGGSGWGQTLRLTFFRVSTVRRGNARLMDGKGRKLTPKENQETAFGDGKCS